MEESKAAAPAEKVSFETALERLGLKRAELYRHLKEGKIKGVKEDDRLSFEAEEVETLRSQLQAAVEELEAGLDRWEPFFAERLGQGAPGADAGETAAGETDKPKAEKPGAPETDAGETNEPKVEERVVALGESILRDLVRLGGNGLYLDPLQKGYRLLYGIQYANSEVARFEPALAKPLCAFFAELAPLPAADAGLERTALGEREAGADALPLRLTAVPTVLGELLHLHLFDPELQALESMGYIEPQAKELRRRLDGRPGVVVLAGAADAEADHHRMALAHELSAAGRLVVSLEHRLHQRSELLVQIDLSQPEGPGFDALWRTALGMGPDAVFIDEIRSPEEAQALVEGAQSGAVVVAQVRAGSARHGLERLKALEVDRQALAESLLAVVERRTFRRLCAQCRASAPLDADLAAGLGLAEGAAAARAVGCARCGDGFEGRQALFGLQPATAELAEWMLAEPENAGPFPAAPETLGLSAALRQAVTNGTVPAGAARPYVRPATEGA